MSQVIRPYGPASVALLLLAVLAGCSDPKNGLFDPDTGKHPQNWLPSRHAAAASGGTTTLGNAIPATAACSECHGADLAGGIANVSCTGCHLGGPAASHPASWVPIVLKHGPSVSTGTTTTAQCANAWCHGPGLAGVPNSGPPCNSCHSVPFTPGSIVCGSCHGIPPSGTRFPDMTGAHATHSAFLGTATAACTICHNGSDGVSGTVRHYDNVTDVALLPAYNALTGGPAAFNGTTAACSGVSCHGGRTTPNWFTGVIDVNTQCSSCHQSGTAQYNSYNSGEHSKHMGLSGVTCTDCHDTARLTAVHFNDLSTQAMNEAPLTLRPSLNYTGSAGAPATGNCTISCHGEDHSSRGW